MKKRDDALLPRFALPMMGGALLLLALLFPPEPFVGAAIAMFCLQPLVGSMLKRLDRLERMDEDEA